MTANRWGGDTVLLKLGHAGIEGLVQYLKDFHSVTAYFERSDTTTALSTLTHLNSTSPIVTFRVYPDGKRLRRADRIYAKRVDLEPYLDRAKPGWRESVMTGRSRPYGTPAPEGPPPIKSPNYRFYLSPYTPKPHNHGLDRETIVDFVLKTDRWAHAPMWNPKLKPPAAKWTPLHNAFISRLTVSYTMMDKFEHVPTDYILSIYQEYLDAGGEPIPEEETAK